MKKPPKRKPNRRAAPRTPARAAARAQPRLTGQPDAAPVLARTLNGARGGVVVPRPANDDRAAFAMLLLPFLMVAISLMMAQTRRASLPQLPEIARGAPLPSIAIAPPPAIPAPVTPAPAIVERAPVAATPKVEAPYQPPAIAVPAGPQIPGPTAPRVASPPGDIASLETAAPLSPHALSPPAERAQPSPSASPSPPFAAPAPVDAPPMMPVSPPLWAKEFPPPPPSITTANLDPRPQPAPVTLLPPPLPPVADVAPPMPPPAAPFTETVCMPTAAQRASFNLVGRLARVPRQPRLVGVDAETFGRRVARAALEQTQDLVIYTARYQAMAYPMGDVMPLHGACIDVVIRAYRALGIDLQEDIQRARPVRGDPNIDHRRTENMRRFLERHGTSLPVTAFPENYKPGDIVTYHRPFSRVSTSHIAIVTDVIAPTRRPMIVHNRGYGPQLEDALFVDRITGHYRYMGSPLAAGQKNVLPAGEGSADAGSSDAPAKKTVRASFSSASSSKP